MKTRNKSDIYPNWYPDIPDEDMLRRRCRSYIEDRLPPDQLAKQIDKEECAYTREWLVTLYMEELYANARDENWQVSTYLLEELELRLRPIVRIAHGEQVQIENKHLVLDAQTPVYQQQQDMIRQVDDANYKHMEKQIQVLTEDVAQLKKQKQQQPAQEQLFRYISPFVTDPEERLHIHHVIVNTLNSEYSMAELVRILKQLEKQGKIALHTTIQNQYDELVRIGLHTSAKGFTCKNYENYMSAQKKNKDTKE